MMKRDFDPHEPELMDRPQPVTVQFELTLRNLADMNRRFGGHRLVRRFLSSWLTPGSTYRVLDLCTGSGDIPRAMVTWARARDIRLRIDAVDASEAIVDIARRASTDFPEIRFLKENALKFEPDESYDLVTCSLALHHFSEEEAAGLLRRCREISHRFVLVADLERSWATLLGIQVLTGLFYREAVTRSDGITSAYRAFSFAEMRALAEAAGWRDFGHARFLFCRQAIWLDLRVGAEIPLTAALDEGLPCPT